MEQSKSFAEHQKVLDGTARHDGGHVCGLLGRPLLPGSQQTGHRVVLRTGPGGLSVVSYRFCRYLPAADQHRVAHPVLHSVGQ